MYFFMIRPQQRQRKEHQAMMSKLRPGDHVVTISRLHGVVSEVNEQEQTVTLDCEGIYLTFDLVAVQRVESSSKKEDKADSKTSDESSSKDEASQKETAKSDEDAKDTPADDHADVKDADDSKESVTEDSDSDSAK